MAVIDSSTISYSQGKEHGEQGDVDKKHLKSPRNSPDDSLCK